MAVPLIALLGRLGARGGGARGLFARPRPSARQFASNAKQAAGNLRLDVDSNASKVQRAIQGLSKQMPFATAGALTATAFDVRKAMVKTIYPSSFGVKNRGFANAMFRVDKANKKKLEARLYDRFSKDYMVNQAEGGNKPLRGRYSPVPASDRPRVSSKSTYERNKPRTVLNRPKAFIQTANNSTMILERRTKKRYPLKKLYVLYTGSPRIPKRFPFYERGHAIAKMKIEKNFAKSFAKAKATAKRRR